MAAARLLTCDRLLVCGIFLLTLELAHACLPGCDVVAVHVPVSECSRVGRSERFMKWRCTVVVHLPNRLYSFPTHCTPPLKIVHLQSMSLSERPELTFLTRPSARMRMRAMMLVSRCMPVSESLLPGCLIAYSFPHLCVPSFRQNSKSVHPRSAWQPDPSSAFWCE
jgi:hypothetical protein